MKTLIVSDFDDPTEVDLQELFWRFGRVEKVSMHVGNAGRYAPLRYALLTMEDDRAADEALAYTVKWRERRLSVEAVGPELQVIIEDYIASKSTRQRAGLRQTILTVRS